MYENAHFSIPILILPEDRQVMLFPLSSPGILLLHPPLGGMGFTFLPLF
jgi:hypothetical protein